LPIGVFRQTDGARRGDAFQARRDIDAIAHQVAVALSRESMDKEEERGCMGT
jgi:hypothetical protein